MHLRLRFLRRQRFHFIGIICFSLISQCYSQEHTSGFVSNTKHAADTGFTDENGNQYEIANFNFCPHSCSCLDDYFECKKSDLKQAPALPKWVRSLDLTGNKLDDSVVNTIANFTGLISLNLKKNRLQRIPVFKGLLSLEKLVLAHNKIQGVTKESFLALPNLRELDLSKNAIRTILPSTFLPSNKLTCLNFNFNAIRSLEENSFEHLKGLHELQINHNRLKSLPAGTFKDLSILKKLDLSNNKLEITWSTFKGLSELKVLRLRSNGIGNLADGVFHALKSIVTIELDSNEITVLNRQGFYNLSTLTSLTLANNSIERIEADTWEFTQQLLTLDLSHNNLTELSRQHLEYLNTLQKLSFGYNNIHHVADGAFDIIKNLEQLDLSNNKLSWMIEDASGPFKLLKKLQKLDLSRNNATSINQKAFFGLQSLQVLNLGMNNLTTIQCNAFESLQQLQNLMLSSDHFHCDCNLQWFYNWLKSTRKARLSSVVCDYPVNLRGTDLLMLKDEDFMCNESPKPRLIKEPSNQLAIKGTNVTLECSAISSLSSAIAIQWRRDNNDINQNETETKIIETSNNNTITSSFLHLPKVTHDNTGKYQCVTSNSFGTTYSKKFKITVATYPGFRKVPGNLTLNVGSTARLDCSAYGEPTPQIAWQKDGGNDFPAARERRMHVMPTDDAFFIINAKASDMGVYTCTAKNPAGVIKANATLTVYEAPAFVKPLRSKEVHCGQSSVLECMSSGSPKPTLRWFKDDEPLQLTDRYFFAAEGQLLIIVDVNLSDSGIYKCELENDLATVSGFLTLKVNKSILKSVVNVEEVTGIVIITVFCCAVGTSVIWVIIIYQTKKRSNNSSSSTDYNSNMQSPPNSSTNSDNNEPNGNALTNLNENSINGNYIPAQDESRYHAVRTLYNSQVVNINDVENNEDDIPHNLDTTKEMENDNFSKKDCRKCSRNSAEDLSEKSSQPRVNDLDNLCQIDNFDKPIIIYRPTVSCNNNKHQLPQYKTNQKQQKDDSNFELSTPLISQVNNDLNVNVNSISVHKNSTDISDSNNIRWGSGSK